MIGFDATSSSNSMDITESFRPEDLSKTDFFDFVTAPDLGGIATTGGGSGGAGGGGADSCSSGVGNNSEQPLQGYDQV